MEIDQKTRQDIAYICFIPLGLLNLTIAITSIIPMNNGVAGGLGFLVLIPLSIFALASAPIGIYFSIVARRDIFLHILSVLTVFMVAEVVTEAGSTDFYNAMPWIYGILVLVFELTWFLLRRKQ